MVGIKFKFKFYFIVLFTKINLKKNKNWVESNILGDIFGDLGYWPCINI